MSELSPYAIVYVDDEAMALKYFEKGFGQSFRVFTATSAAEGWDIVQKHASEVGVLMSDQRMPGQTGVELLEKVRHAYPQIIRILVTAYSDIESAIAGVNEGAIYRYISKPWDVTDLRITLLRALEFFAVLKERDQLLREKLAVLQNILLSDRTKNLGVFAAGLHSTFRNAVDAAERFVAAIPRDNPEPLSLETGRVPLAKTIQGSVKKAGEEIFALMNSTADAAEPVTGQSFKKQPLADLLKSFGEKNSVSIQLPASLPEVALNEKQVLKLLTLLAASVRAVAEGNPSLSLSVEPLAGRIPSVELRLSDGGSAWTARQRHRFFAPFSAVKDDANLGLGLATAYFIAHHHGGRIAVPGSEGIKLRVELPLDPSAIQPSVSDPDQLSQIFHFERNWEDFLTQQK